MADSDGDDKRKAEHSLFRDATRDVRRLSTEPRHDLGRVRPPRARLSRAARVARLAGVLADPQQPYLPVTQAGDGLSFRRDGVTEQAFRQLRRGQVPVEAELDLHGLTAARAEAALTLFLAEALAQQLEGLRIVHGKGLRSGERGPVLRLLVSDFLRRVGAVQAFASARVADGGSGATLVLLAPGSRSRQGRNLQGV